MSRIAWNTSRALLCSWSHPAQATPQDKTMVPEVLIVWPWLQLLYEPVLYKWRDWTPTARALIIKQEVLQLSPNRLRQQSWTSGHTSSTAPGNISFATLRMARATSRRADGSLSRGSSMFLMALKPARTLSCQAKSQHWSWKMEAVNGQLSFSAHFAGCYNV